MKLRLENIEKNYDRPVIKNLSYCFESGKIYVIKGVSGCGKSTLFNIIGGLERDFSGEIYIDDEKCNKDINDNVGYIFQQSLLLSGMSVMENLLLIKNNRERVLELSRQLGIEKLLDKFPEQISGGERQRVAIVRALLLEPDILLADEPTASLDKTNSKITADIIYKLKSDERIIIVATHEKYFDEIADEIIYLKYGAIEKVEQKEQADINKGGPAVNMTGSNIRDNRINAIKYNLKRNKKMLKPVALLPFVIMFLIILIASTVQNSFSDEYMRDSINRYPMDAFNICDYDLKVFQYPDRINVYEYYVSEENGITALYLSDKADSVFSVDGMIQYGKFPASDNEILVSYEYAVAQFGEDDLGKNIGKEIIFRGREFVISGIAYSLDENVVADNKNASFKSYYESDAYYDNTEGMIIYIPYDTIKEFVQPGVKKISTVTVWRASCRNLFSDEEVLNAVRNATYNGVNIFEQQINYSQDILDMILIILLLVFVVCFIIACIFMSSQIQIELFYRRKELGFLQIFGLKKKRIRELVFTGYLMRIVLSMLIAFVIYTVSVSIYNIVCQSSMIFNYMHIALIFVAMVVFYIITVLMATNRFLRKNIIALIVE